MAKIKENDGKKGGRPAVWLCLFSLALLGAGCSTANKNKGDPLLGEFGPKGEGAKTPPAKTSTKQVPPIPTATTGINANLAAGTLPGSRTLAISQPQANPAGGAGSLTAGSKENAGAILNKPEPVVQPVPRDNTQVVPAGQWDKGQLPPPPDPLLAQQPRSTNLPPSQRPEDPVFAQFKAQLQSRGITVSSYRADNVAGGVKFTCLIPNPQNPQVTRAYEAIGPDYPAAVRAVLWEIDNKR